jgi:hypothetical protein
MKVGAILDHVYETLPWLADACGRSLICTHPV